MPRRRGHGEGSIFKRSDGLWVAKLELEPGDQGERRRRVLYGRSRREVLDKLDLAKVNLREGQEPPLARAARVTVGQVLDDWLASLDKAGENKRALTRERYRIASETQVRPFLGTLEIRRLDGDRVEAWQHELLDAGYAPRSVWKARTVLGHVVRVARRRRPPLIRENPLELVDPPAAAKPDKRILTVAETERFVRALSGDSLETLLLTVLMLGARAPEVIGLRWRDVDWTARTVSIERQVQRHPHVRALQVVEPKSDAGTRVLPLPSLLLDHLRRHRARQVLASGDLIFPSGAGTPMEPRNLRRAFEAFLKRAEIAPLTLHELRHSASSVLQSLGVPPLVVAQLLGHADPAVTMRAYGHVVVEAHREAMDVMDGYIRRVSGERLGTHLGTPTNADVAVEGGS